MSYTFYILQLTEIDFFPHRVRPGCVHLHVHRGDDQELSDLQLQEIVTKEADRDAGTSTHSSAPNLFTQLCMGTDGAKKRVVMSNE